MMFQSHSTETSDVINTIFQDQELNFKTKTLKFFQEQDQDQA